MHSWKELAMAPLHLVSSNNYFQSELALNVLINPSLSLLRDAFSSINFSKGLALFLLEALQMSGLWQRKPLEVNTSHSPETGMDFPLP